MCERINAPFVDDRDITLRIVASVDSASRVFGQEFALALDADPPPIGGVVRSPLSKGRWRLEADDPSTTRIVYEIHTDPGAISLIGW